MTHFLLSVYQPQGDLPPAEFLAAVGRDLQALNQELKAAGAWVFSRGLEAASEATVVQPRDQEVLLTDGPYIESKEHVGGFWIIQAADVAAALRWAAKAARATTLPIEVRALRDP